MKAELTEYLPTEKKENKIDFDSYLNSGMKTFW